MPQGTAMNTECPHCRTVFRLGQEQLDAAEGRVRCGQCRQVFDARARLQKELPLAGTPGADPGQQPDLGFGDPPAGTVSGVLLSDLGTTTDVRTRRSRGALAAWAAIDVVLLLALGAQLLFVQRAVFAQEPTLRPLLEPMCELAECALAPLQAVDRIELVHRDVYRHPSRDDALLIDATIVNNAGFAQPYPAFTVGLGDRRGRILSRRSFAPGEYIDGFTPEARMAPGLPVRVTLELEAPDHPARTFEFDFAASG